MVGGTPEETAANRVFRFLFFSPVQGGKRTCLPSEAGIISTRAALPAPLARPCRNQPHPEGISAVPEAIDALMKPGSGQVNPDGQIRIRVCIGTICKKG